jgi:serine/threonine protein phosphatase PrpC
MVPESEIAGIMAEAPAVRIAAERLVERANEHGGQDNITVVVIRLSNNNFRSWVAKFVPWYGANLV